MSEKSSANSFLSLLGTRNPLIEQTREEHVNTARHLRGIAAAQRKKLMEKQLRSLITVNDFYTAPNRQENRRSFASQALFSNIAVKASNRSSLYDWD